MNYLNFTKEKAQNKKNNPKILKKYLKTKIVK